MRICMYGVVLFKTLKGSCCRLIFERKKIKKWDDRVAHWKSCLAVFSIFTIWLLLRLNMKKERERERKWQGSCKGWRWSLGTSTATFSLSGFLDMLKIELLCGGKRKTERKKGAAILKSQKHEMSYTISFSLLLCLLNACSRQSDPWLE